MSAFSVFWTDTGIFTGARVGGPPDLVARQTPAGCDVWPGEHDCDAVRVDLTTGSLVPYQPPPPADTAWHTWVWDEPAWRWAAQPTVATLAIEARAERGRRLSACDWVVARATELAEPVPPAWLSYRAALRAVPEQPAFPVTIEWPEPPAV